jgi:hypothetical protein
MAKPSAVSHAPMVSAVIAVDVLTPHNPMPRSLEWGFIAQRFVSLRFLLAFQLLEPLLPHTSPPKLF